MEKKILTYNNTKVDWLYSEPPCAHLASTVIRAQPLLIDLSLPPPPSLVILKHILKHHCLSVNISVTKDSCISKKKKGVKNQHIIITTLEKINNNLILLDLVSL